jgi:hypothetical protein
VSPDDFLKTLFEGIEGHLCLIETNGKGEWNNQRFYEWPTQQQEATSDVQWSLDRSLGYSPFLYEEAARRGEVGGTTLTVGLDADHHGPNEFREQPSIVVETSPGSYHLLWILIDPISKEDAVEVGKRMRDAHNLEASATNSSKVLRFPGSVNLDSEKVLAGGTPFTVTAHDSGLRYTLEDLKTAYPFETKQVTTADVDETYPSPLPTLFEAESKLTNTDRLKFLMDWREVDQIGGERERRSERIHELCHLLLEQGLTPAEALVVGWSADPVREHYADKHRSMEEFWRYDLLKAVRQKDFGVVEGEVEPSSDPTIPSAPKPKRVILLTDTERQFVSDNPTWVDEWLAHCYSRLDERTPKEYLIALGYLLLSCTLSSGGTGVYSNERVDPNLYVLNLGPTGTGKTESLRFWRRCLRAFEDQAGYKVDIGNEGSPEGLIKALKDYDDRVAIVTKDEVGGMFAEWANRGYQVKAPETFMELYSSEVPTRLLVSKDAGNPERVKLHAFNLYMTGTPEKVYRVLTEEFYESGFMQRVIPILGHRDETTELSYREAKVQGDPRHIERMDQLPVEIADHLYERTSKNAAVTGDGTRQLVFFDSDAWERWVDLGWSMRLSVVEMERGEHLVAVMERLALSVLKMAVLLALEKNKSTVGLVELLPVIQHCEAWVRNVIVMSSEISESEHSRRVDEAVTLLSANNGKVPLRKFYNTSPFKALKPRDADEVLVSLKSRGLARQAGDGRGVEWLIGLGIRLDNEKKGD